MNSNALTIAVCTLLFVFGRTLMADENDIAPVPNQGENPAEIVKFMVENFGGLGSLKERIHQVEYGDNDGKVFLVWFNPYSGESACHFHGYRYSQKNRKWVRFVSKTFDGTHDLSVAVSTDQVCVRDVAGKVVYRMREENKRTKGVELYGWKIDGEWVFVLVDGTNRIKSEKEIKANRHPLRGLQELEQTLYTLAIGEQVVWRGLEESTEELRREIKKATTAAGVKLIE